MENDKQAARRRRRSAARLAAVQALYQMEMTGASWRKVRNEFLAHRIGEAVEEGAPLSDANPEHFSAVLEGVVARQRDIDPAIDAAMKESWPLGRIDPTLRALFRAGSHELLAGITPPKVVITEYVDIAKAFFDGEEPRFANAVLDALARRLRADAMAPRS